MAASEVVEVRTVAAGVCIAVISFYGGQLVQWVKNARRRDKRGE